MRELQGELDDWGGVGRRRNLCLRASLKHNPLSSGKCPWSLSSVLGRQGQRMKTEWSSHKILVRCYKSKVFILWSSCKKVASRYISAVSTQSELGIGYISQRYKKWSRDYAHSFHTIEAWLITLMMEEWKTLRGLRKSLPWSFPEHKGSYGRREPKISNYLFNDNKFNVITYLMIIFIKLDIVFKSTVNHNTQRALISSDFIKNISGFRFL